MIRNRRFWIYRNTILVFILFFTSHDAMAQSHNQQIEFVLANDKFANQDKYFSNGLYLSYQKLLNKKFILPKTMNTTLQLNLAIGNETYSPTSLSSTNTNAFDRPFAGWLFGRFEVGSIKEKTAFFLTFETGITGKESLAGSLQTTFHDLFGINSEPTWIEQIEFKWLFNIKISHSSNWQLNNHHALRYTLSPSIGTKDIYMENGVTYFFGKFNAFQNSARIGAIDSSQSNEFFGYISAGYRFVAHNTLIRGSLFKEEVLFTTDFTNHIVRGEAGVVLKSKRNTFKLLYNFNTKETPISTSHTYGSLVYARSF